MLFVLRPPLFALCVLFSALSSYGQEKRAWKPPERLDRGLVVVPGGKDKTYFTWRKHPEDAQLAAGTKMEVLRHRAGKPSILASLEISGPSCFLLPEAAQATDSFSVEISGSQVPSTAQKCRAEAYFEIPLIARENYTAGDCSAADLDGDGTMEIIVHRVSQGKDNGSSGVTGKPILEAYKLTGEFLWHIDLGKNIREGEHYTQFMVYDLDGDGLAELACKTADGTIDGTGVVIGDAAADHRHLEEGSAKHGRILKGPEFLSVFRGKDGKALHTVPYEPSRSPIDGWGGKGGNGGSDSYGNRCDRFLACVAYLSGPDAPPSLVMIRGVYGRTVLVAWDFKNEKLVKRWTFDTGSSKPPFADASPYSGMGGHSLAVADVDADGRDEVVYQAMTVDDDGKGLFTTGRRHGDVMYVSDFDPARPGMELYLVTENEHPTDAWGTPGQGLHDARTGQPLWTDSPGVDVPHGMVADIDPRHPGAEVWGGPGGLRNIQGKKIGQAPRSDQWTIWWDGDLLRELYSTSRILKWDWEKAEETLLFDARASRPGEPPPVTFGKNRRFMGFRPNLAADLIGDWREELLLVSPSGTSLRLHLSTLPSEHGLPCLLFDRQYRLSVVWQNVVYNKPCQPSFFLGNREKDAAK